MRKKQNVARNPKTTKRMGDNTSVRRIVLILGLVSLLIFLCFVYLYVSNGRKIINTQNAVNDQVALVNRLDQQYFSVLNGGSDAPAILKDSIAKFDTALINIEHGSNIILAPREAQMLAIKDVKTKWASVKSSFEHALSTGGAITDVKTGAANTSSVLSDIKLSATRLNSNLDTFANAGSVSRSLTDIVSVSEGMDTALQSVLLQDKTIEDVSPLLSAQSEKLALLVNSVGEALVEHGGSAFSSPNEGKKELNALNKKLESILNFVPQLTGSLPKAVGANGRMRDTVGQESSLVAALNKLKNSYAADSTYPIAAFPLSYLNWMIFWLIATVALIGVWAIMLLRNSARLNQEATRLRIAAEERTQNDQEAILRLMDELADLSEGDLTIEAQVTEDFTGAIADSINFTVENMRDMVGTITHTSDEITRATGVSQDVARLLSESSSEQSRQIDTSTATVRQMATSLHEISENTDSSVDIARSSVDFAQEGRNRVQSTIRSMGDIRENIQETAKRIKRLGESSQEIGDIVEIIKGIADQTNVLALNAAIQATSAGEAGRGFAVVADEVQRLAERSANATKRIEVLVKTIQADANEAIASMENSTQQVVTGTDVAEEAGQSLERIEDVSKSLASLIVNVSTATRDAAGMAGSVADNMGHLATLNEKAVEDVTTSVKSVEDLRELSTSLKDSVAGFKLP